MRSRNTRIGIVVAAGALALSLRAAAETKLIYLDLQPQGNHRLSEDLHETQGNHWGELPQGELKFGESRWKIGEQMIHLHGKNAPKAPEKVAGIKVGAKFARLHILHSTGYGENPMMDDGTEVGAYTINYADDTTERVPIIYGEDIRDWWDWPERPNLKRAKVAWTGTNPAAKGNERMIRAFQVIWVNPKPDKEVKSIDVNASGTECDPFIFALTIEQK
jgi:hypothetical protein